MDGTKRAAFASALFFLECCGYSIPEKLPINDVVDFCVSVAEENLRLARGENINPVTVPEIAHWLQQLLADKN